MHESAAALVQLVAAVAASARYRAISPDLVRRIGERELERRRSLKEAIKATKNVLHQVGGAYLGRRINYGAYLAEMRAAARAGDQARLRQLCLQAMACHASSRERLPILGEFYAATLGSLPPVRSLLDVACGLNPLALLWMPLAPGAAYYACDIYSDMVAFLGQFFSLMGVQGGAEVCDVTTCCPARHVDVALVLKTIPCLEQLDPAAGTHLFDTIDADHLLVSFPVRSLGGAEKGMPAHYEAHLMDLLASRGWAVRRFAFASELAFLLSR